MRSGGLMDKLRHIFLSVTAVLMASSASVTEAAPRTERVTFPKGATSKAIKGAIKGYDYVDYVIGARGGQLRSCPTGWCKSRRSKVGSGSGQAATAGRLTMGLWLTEPRVSSVM